MSKDMLIAVGAGVTSGLASLAVLSGLPGALLAVYIAPLPLLLVGLDQGIKAGTIAGASGIVTSTIAGNLLSGGLFTIIHALPSWIIVKQGLSKYVAPDIEKEVWYPAGSILCILSLLSAVTLILATVWFQGEVGGLQGIMRSYLDQVFIYWMPMDEAIRGDLVQLMIPLFPGYIGTSWIIMIVFNAYIAFAILTRAKRVERSKTGLANLVLPDWMSWLIVISASITLLGQNKLEFFSHNLTLILSVPFFFLGLAVLHKLAGYVTFPRVLLLSFYLALILSGWVAVVITFTGIIEQWFGLRRYFKNYS